MNFENENKTNINEKNIENMNNVDIILMILKSNY